MGRGRSSSGGSRGGSSSRGSSSSSRSRGYSSRSYSGRGGFRSTNIFIGGFGSNSNYSGAENGNYNNSSKKSSSIALAIIFILFALIPFFMAISGFVRNNAYSKTTGVCINNTYSMGWYYTTYEYNVEGRDYESRSLEGWEFPESIGKSVTIYYLKSNPNEISEILPVDPTGNAVTFMVGIGFMTAGIALLVANLKKKENDIQVNSGLDELKQSQETVKQNKCEYCGTRLEENYKSCPNCGANIK